MAHHSISEFSDLITEQRNPNSIHIDELSTLDVLKVINQEDHKVAGAIEKILPDIEEAIELIYQAFLKGGRLFYIGAGTSGRLAVLDASECVPTFLTPPEQVQAIMAGGASAFIEASEVSEDDLNQGAVDLKSKGLTSLDVVVGITASGRTPYPIGALKYAKELGCHTVSLTCNENSTITQHAECKIEVVVGPEILTGSTRMKAGTAHKMILNMISTTVMIKMGKVYENLMVDVNANNYKLLERAKHIVMEITEVPYEQAEDALNQSHYRVKPAVVMLLSDVSFEQADEAIKGCDGHLRMAIDYAKKHAH